MKKLALLLTVAACATFASPGGARAEIGTADAVPAATLLLPYFEVDLGNPAGINTLLAVNNASASASLAHVTLWTDEGIPTFNFDVYLTGFDVQVINLRSIFDNGALPVTADDAADPGDTPSPSDGISNQGLLSQDINFPGSSGPCGDGSTVYSNPELTEIELQHIRRAHTGRRSAVLNGCVSAQYGDLIARGYVTIDSTTQCSLLNPTDPGYFAGVSDNRNILWGDYSFVQSADNFSTGGALVHIEACGAAYQGFVGNGAGLCPFAAGEYTFYGRLNGFTATDTREPLPTTFATRYLTSLDTTDLLVWRDTKEPVTGLNARHHCVNQETTWFPLPQSDVVGFDEAENPTDLCAAGECFPLATQRVPVATGNPLGTQLAPPAAAGWLYLNLNHAGGSAIPGVAQAWVSSTQSSSGRFSVGFQAIALDNASATGAGGILLIP
jgi:hypothetical protein